MFRLNFPFQLLLIKLHTLLDIEFLINKQVQNFEVLHALHQNVIAEHVGQRILDLLLCNFFNFLINLLIETKHDAKTLSSAECLDLFGL